MTRYIIRFDDFYVGMPRCLLREVADAVKAQGIPAILGVVPAWANPVAEQDPVGAEEFWATIRDLQAQGCEIALHGWSHVLFEHPNLLGVNRYGEFAGLDPAEQEMRLRRGREVFAANGVNCRMFMPPAHSFDTHTLRALVATGIPLLTDGKSFYPFRWEGLLCLPQISSNFRDYPWGLITICLHPQWMTPATYAELARFRDRHGQAVVGVDEGIACHASLGPLVRVADRLTREAHALSRRLR